MKHKDVMREKDASLIAKIAERDRKFHGLSINDAASYIFDNSSQMHKDGKDVKSLTVNGFISMLRRIESSGNISKEEAQLLATSYGKPIERYLLPESLAHSVALFLIEREYKVKKMYCNPSQVGFQSYSSPYLLSLYLFYIYRTVGDIAVFKKKSEGNLIYLLMALHKIISADFEKYDEVTISDMIPRAKKVITPLNVREIEDDLDLGTVPVDFYEELKSRISFYSILEDTSHVGVRDDLVDENYLAISAYYNPVSYFALSCEDRDPKIFWAFGANSGLYSAFGEKQSEDKEMIVTRFSYMMKEKGGYVSRAFPSLEDVVKKAKISGLNFTYATSYHINNS